VAVVQTVGANVARIGEPLEPLLHALRIGARVGWQETLSVTLESPGTSPDQMLLVAGQVFEYIDQLSSRIAGAYAAEVEQSVRERALSESAIFEDLVAGRQVSAPEGPAGAPPRVALAVAGAGADRGAAQRAAGGAAGRLRTRLPNVAVGQRNGLSVWLLPRDPLPQLLVDCAGPDPVAFGISRVAEDVTLTRAVDEAVEAAYLGLELGAKGGPAVIDFQAVHPYAALRADPGALARYQQAVLGPLLQRPALLETLRQYFFSGRSVSATADRVHRHRQSVVYRLRRISQLLGVGLDDAEAMFRLEAAVRTLAV
jgi:hypothetical protein